jgi:hypothetical protein
MRLNKMFGDLFDKILNSKKNRKSLFKIINNYYNEELLDDKLILCLIKSLILILSYHPKKFHICINIIKKYEECHNNLQKDIFKCLKSFNLSNQLNLSDEIVEKVIYNTIIFLEKVYKVCENQVYSIWYILLINISKIEKDYSYLKTNMYLVLLKESDRILAKYNTKSYLKITELCNNMIKLINNY